MKDEFSFNLDTEMDQIYKMLNDATIKHFDNEIFKSLIEENIIFSSKENIISFLRVNKDIILNLYQKLLPNHIIFLEEVYKDNLINQIDIELLIASRDIIKVAEEVKLLPNKEFVLLKKLIFSAAYFTDKKKTIFSMLAVCNKYDLPVTFETFKNIIREKNL
jgi:hypothetical protein